MPRESSHALSTRANDFAASLTERACLARREYAGERIPERSLVHDATRSTRECRTLLSRPSDPRALANAWRFRRGLRRRGEVVRAPRVSALPRHSHGPATRHWRRCSEFDEKVRATSCCLARSRHSSIESSDVLRVLLRKSLPPKRSNFRGIWVQRVTPRT